jgi:multiple sugar transport system substrate-binding protein
MRRLMATLGVAVIVVSCGGGGASPSSGVVAPTGTAAVPAATPTTAVVEPTGTAAVETPAETTGVAPSETTAVGPSESAGVAPSESAAAETPVVTPEITQPPAVVLTDYCAGSGASPAPSEAAGGVNAWAAGISGPVKISGWQSTGAEGDALTQTLCAAQAALPNLQITYQPIAGDYVAVMTANIAAHDVPDLFYVNADYAQSWINNTYLLQLDDDITKASFDTSAFFPGYASIFKNSAGNWFGFPKDGNTIGMAYNTDIVKTPPKTLAELVTWAKGAKGKGTYKAPLCLNPGLDRGLAFLYAEGGAVVSADGKTDMIDSDASKTAIQWYMNLFKDGLGMTASDMGDGWCGDAIGKGDAAVIFEGGWLDPAMTSTYPNVHYAWAPVPTGSTGKPVTISFTVSYSIGADAAYPDQAFALATYLTGPAGMQVWTQGGVALPSRKDVPSPPGKDVLTAESAYAKPGSGFMPGWGDVQSAFQNAFIDQIQKKTFEAGPVIAATKTAVDTAISGQ